MTTICYRDGVLAADSAINYAAITNGFREKIARCGDYLVAMAGKALLRATIEEWTSAGCPIDEVPNLLLDNEDHFSALFVDREGRVYEFDNGFLVPIHADYTAIGSGSMLAMGAMAVGASAEEAVMAASQHDKNTGGPVSVRHFSSLS